MKTHSISETSIKKVTGSQGRLFGDDNKRGKDNSNSKGKNNSKGKIRGSSLRSE
jgi:hypothetical protein